MDGWKIAPFHPSTLPPFLSRFTFHVSRFTFLFLLIFLFGFGGSLTLPAFAQQNFQWRNFTRIGDGLSSNNVRSITEDRSGQIWLATGVGLSRFDGFWHAIGVPGDNANANDVFQVLEDAHGFIWAATSAGLHRGVWNSQRNQIDWLGHYTVEAGLIDNRILTILQRRNGEIRRIEPVEIWIGTPLGVNWFDGAMWHPVANAEEGMLNQGVRVIYEDVAGNLWFGLSSSSTPERLSRFDGSRWDIFGVNDGLPNGIVQAISEDSLGNLWVGTTEGLAIYDGSTWQVATALDLLVGNNVQTIMRDSEGTMWVGTASGISLFDHGRWSHLTRANGLASNNIQALFEARNGEIWVGTRDNGVNFSDRSWKSLTTDNGLSGDSVTAMLTDGNGRLWVGTTHGLSRYTMDGVERINGPLGAEIRALAEDGRGRIWVGTDSGIGVFDGVSWQIFRLPDINNNSVQSISVDSGGDVWVGTGILLPGDPVGFLPGLNRYDGVQWHLELNLFQEINRTIAVMFVDSRGRLYLGTVGNEREGNELWVYTPGEQGGDLRRIDGMPNRSIHTIMEAPPVNGGGNGGGDLWVGTDGGIQILNGETLQATALLTTDDGLVDTHVQALYRDRRGQIWIGTADGVNLFTSPFPPFAGGGGRTLTASDGLNSNNISAITETHDGTLWFGSKDDGVSRFNQEMTRPTTRIISGPTKGEIVGDTSVFFRFEGGDASTLTRELRYQYQLDDRPQMLTENNGAEERLLLQNLAEGKHRFVVRAIDREGNVDAAGAQAEFVVDSLPPTVSITQPKRGAVIGGVYPIEGTATDGTDFLDYQIQIFSGAQVSGNPLFAPFISTQPVQGNRLYAWDTRTAADDLYTIQLLARDTPNGNFDRSHRAEEIVTIEVDNTSPRAQIKRPLLGATISGAVNVEIELTDAHLSRYTLEYALVESADNWTRVVSESIVNPQLSLISSTVRWDTSTIYGQVFLRASVEDTAGNIGRSEITPLDLKNEGAKPVVEILEPSGARPIAGEVAIIGTVAPGTAQGAVIENFRLEYRLVSFSAREAWRLIRSSQSRFSQEEITRWDTTKLPDGTYVLRLTVTDNRTYESQIEKVVTLDNTPPKAVIESPKAGMVLGTGSIEVNGTATDENFESFRLEYSTSSPLAEGGEVEWMRIAESNNPVQEGRLGDWNAVRLTGGEYLLRLTVFDRAGLKSQTEPPFRLFLDDAQVTALITSPGAGAFVGGTIQITGTANDENFSEYKLEFRPLTPPAAGEGGGWQPITVFSPNQPKRDEPLASWETPQRDGTYELRLTASDRSGKSSQDVVDIFVDNLPPQAQILTPEDGEILSGEVEIIGTADDVHFKEYQLDVRAVPPTLAGDGEGWQPIPVQTPSQAKRNATLAMWDTPPTEGEYEIRLIARDQAGRSNESVVRAIIDNQPPAVQIVQPVNLQLVSKEIEIIGTADDALFKEYQLDFRAIPPPSAGGDRGGWQLIQRSTSPRRAATLTRWVTPEVDGEYELRLTGQDQSGRSRQTSVTVIVDNLPPRAALISPQSKQQLPQRIEIRGTADDHSFKRYTIEYGVGEVPDVWVSISKTAFLQPVALGTLAEWEAPNLFGLYTLRLRVEDAAGHESVAQVHVFFSQRVERQEGGVVQSQDGRARIVFPPNSLPVGTVVTINPIPEDGSSERLNESGFRVQDSGFRIQDSGFKIQDSGFRIQGSGGIASDILAPLYEFAPTDLKLHPLKPATIELLIANLPFSPSANEILTIARWNGEKWVSIGGTIDAHRKTIATAVSTLGRYAVMKIPSVEADSNTTLSDLTCQPRVFSPNRGEATAISFRLNRPDKVTIKIYNEAGRLRRILKSVEPLSAGRQVFWWDGRDDENQRVVSNSYIVAVEGEGTMSTKSVIVQND